MRITDFKVAYQNLNSEMIVCLLMASTFENGYWKHYHAIPCRVVNITPSEINLQFCNNSDTWHRIDKKNLESGQFGLEF